MLSTFIVAQLIYQALVCDASVQPFACPIRCKCKGKRIVECAIESIMEYPEVGRTADIENLSVSFCRQSDFNSFSADTKGYYKVSQMNCDKLILPDDNENSNCVYRSTNIPTQDCVYICSKFNIALLNEKQRTRRQTRKCICYMCGTSVHSHRGVLRVRRSDGGKDIEGGNDTEGNTTGRGEEERKRKLKENLPSIIVIGALSIIAFIINFIVMIKLCCSPLTVIDLFGTALMLFNVILSMYGMSMAIYLFQPSMRKDIKYCRFFTSIKLFSLGSALYTMTFLIFHRPIRRSASDGPERSEVEDGKKLKANKDAIFKGIVFILEGVMLAGVLGVLSWIKTNQWGSLCVLMTPIGSVEELLNGIEVWYFVLSGLLVSWYFGNYIFRKVKILLQYREKWLRKRRGEDEEDGEGLLRNDGDERDQAEIAPYIVRDFPIFIMVSLSFCIWIGGFILTLPKYNLFKSDISSVIRVCTLILPIIVQPVVYVIRDTCCFRCPCLLGSKHRSNTIEEIKLTKCESDESSPSNNNMQVVTTQFENVGQLPIGKVEQDLNEAPNNDVEQQQNSGETEPLNKKNNFEIPKVVCRSPIQSDERTKLLDDMDGKKPSTPTIIVGDHLDITTEDKGLINGEKDIDVNGRVSRGPTFYPIAEKEIDVRQKQIELKSYTPIKEKNAEEEEGDKEEGGKQINNNRKEKRKDKKGTKKTNSANSTASLDWDSYSGSDSSSSHESHAEQPLNDINSIAKSSIKETEAVTGKMDFDPNKFEGNPSSSELTKLKNKINKPHFNNNNNNNNELDPGERDSLLNSSNNDTDPVSGGSATPVNTSKQPKTHSRSSDAKTEANHTSKKLKKPLLTRDDSGSVER